MNQDQRDALPTPIRPATNPLVLAACWAGREPAERLTRGERDLLLFDLWLKGWDDCQIATFTKLSTYTTCRIRNRLGLTARSASQEAA